MRARPPLYTGHYATNAGRLQEMKASRSVAHAAHVSLNNLQYVQPEPGLNINHSLFLLQ